LDMAYHSSVGCDRRGDQPTGYATPSACFHTPEITITPQDLVKASAGLNLVVYNTDVSQHSDLPWQQRVRIMRNLLSGHFGLDVASAFSPVYALASCESQEVPPAVIEQLRLDEQLRAWGWNCILAGRDEAFPPSNISLK
ncbi:hypothetical protein ACRCO4_29395, partial [Pseudomonas aeruginosa]